MFEHKREAKHARHPIKSRRWTYRSVHKIESLGSSHYEPEEDPVTDEDAAEDLGSDTGGVPTDGETFSTRETKDKDILNILPTDDNFGIKEFGVGMMLD